MIQTLAGDITISAIGANADFNCVSSQPAIVANGGSITLTAGHDVTLDDGVNDILADGDIVIDAGGMVVVESGSEVQAAAFGLSTNSDVTITAGSGIFIKKDLATRRAAALPVKADQLDTILSNKTLRCATYADVPPFSSPDVKTREMVGFDVDLCKAIAKELGVTAEIKPISVEARIPEVKLGRVDITVANLAYTLSRAEQIQYSDPYYVAKEMLIVPADDAAASRKPTMRASGLPRQRVRPLRCRSSSTSPIR